jgi:hypothetical protein
MPGQRVVHVAEPGARAHRRRAARDRHRAHRRDVEIASETSAGVSQSTTACGRTTWNRAMAGLRTES